MASTSLSFRPWSLDQPEQASIAGLLERVNRERGHFRDILESTLQEELAGEGGLDISESENEEEESDEDAEQEENGRSKASTREELFRAKFDMLQQVSFAHNEIMMALDFVSLLESKDSTAGRQTMSQYLKENVPAGSLGTDIWHRMPKDTIRETQDTTLAQAVRMECLQKSADNLLGAAKRLEDNVRKETQYWGQILSVTDAGWNVCRLPGQQHKLGVRFGFSESSPEFSRRGIAALHSTEDGTIALERGIGVKPKVLRATVYRHGVVIGRSKVPSAGESSETTLETRIRHARDSLFDEETYREMERECRLLASGSVRVRDSSIILAPSDQHHSIEVHFELLSPDDMVLSDDEFTANGDSSAQAMVYGARLLLCHAHRDKLQRRSQIPPPLSDRKEERAVTPILRPILSLILHHSALESVNAQLGRISTLLEAAEVKHEIIPARLQLPQGKDVQNADDLTFSLLSPWTSQAYVRLHVSEANASLSIGYKVETSLAQSSNSRFTLSVTDRRDIRCSSFEQLRSASDTLLSHLVAKTLALSRPDLQLDGVGGRLLGGSDRLGNRGEIRVKLDGIAGVLTLESAKEEAKWTLDGHATSKSLLQACQEFG